MGRLVRALACIGGVVAQVAAAGAHAQFTFRAPSDSLPLITTSAIVTVPVQADRATVYVSLAERDTVGPAAVAAAQALRDRVQAAVQRAGVPADHVAPFGFTFGRPEQPGMMEGGRPAGPRTLSARWGLRVLLDRVDRLDAVLAAIAQAGGEATPFVEFVAPRDGPAVRAASEQAVAQARQQAETMARAAGGRLGELVSLGNYPDGYASFNNDTRFFSYAGGFERSGTLIPSDVSIRVGVVATWRFVHP